MQVEAVRQFSPAWAAPVFGANGQFNSARGSAPAVTDLATLGMVASYLSAVAPEGRAPDEEQVKTLAEDVADLIAAIQDSSDLSPDVLRLILQHLSKVEWALRHLRIGGPGAVKAATEALLGAVVLETPESVRETATWKRVVTVVGAVWVVFTGLPEAQTALEAWQGAGRTAIEQVAPDRDDSGDVLDGAIVPRELPASAQPPAKPGRLSGP
jgi:hypothetical protein